MFESSLGLGKVARHRRIDQNRFDEFLIRVKLCQQRLDINLAIDCGRPGDMCRRRKAATLRSHGNGHRSSVGGRGAHGGKGGRRSRGTPSGGAAGGGNAYGR